MDLRKRPAEIFPILVGGVAGLCGSGRTWWLGALCGLAAIGLLVWRAEMDVIGKRKLFLRGIASVALAVLVATAVGSFLDHWDDFKQGLADGYAHARGTRG